MLPNPARLFTAIFVVFSSLFGHSLTRAQKDQQQIPVTISENVIYVKVHINGRGPYNFMLDTGSSGIGRIDRHLAKELGLNIVGFDENSDGYHLVKREFLVGVEKLSLGQITQSNLKLMVSDYNITTKQIPIDGMIGRDFFNDYLLTIDGPGHQLIVSRGMLNAQLENVIGYTKAFLVPGKVGQTNRLFNLDTGSNLSLFFPTSALAGIRYTNTLNKRSITRGNVTFMLQEAIINEDVVLGAIKLKDQKIYYSDKAHQISVGEDFLKDHTITLDQRKKLVRIE